MPGVLRSVAAGAGLWFESWVLEDLYLALRTKPFLILILPGLSGTGNPMSAAQRNPRLRRRRRPMSPPL
ncbi:MAG: hypothetical protein JWP83_4377 [Mycobacterium sp.]|nr:hypothetical protein [Mycobacterium sp.]